MTTEQRRFCRYCGRLIYAPQVACSAHADVLALDPQVLSGLPSSSMIAALQREDAPPAKGTEA